VSHYNFSAALGIRHPGVYVVAYIYSIVNVRSVPSDVRNKVNRHVLHLYRLTTWLVYQLSSPSRGSTSRSSTQAPLGVIFL
jgi:hypothetical protein